jgi:8-oxo-dGTP diphosphatase
VDDREEQAMIAREKWYAVGFMVAPETDQVLLIRKNRPAWQAGRLNGIGGHVEPGESPYECMLREFGEETGLAYRAWTTMLCMEFPGARIWFYRAHVTPDYLRLAKTTTDEPVEVHRIGALLTDAEGKRMLPNLRWLLPMAVYTADTYATFTLKASVAEVLPEMTVGEKETWVG